MAEQNSDTTNFNVRHRLKIQGQTLNMPVSLTEGRIEQMRPRLPVIVTAEYQ